MAIKRSYNGVMSRDDFASLVTCAGHLFDVKVSDILSKRRYGSTAVARQCVQYIMRHDYKLSYPRIAHFFEADHTTILYNTQRFSEIILNDADLASSWRCLRQTMKIDNRERDHIITRYIQKNLPYAGVTSEYDELCKSLDSMLEPLGYRLGLKKLEKE